MTTVQSVHVVLASGVGSYCDWGESKPRQDVWLVAVVSGKQDAEDVIESLKFGWERVTLVQKEARVTCPRFMYQPL